MSDPLDAAEWLPTHRHYKGGLYRFLFTAKLTEEEGFVAIYENAQRQTFARPYDMWTGKLPDGRWRFETIPPNERRVSRPADDRRETP